ncbi:MAG: tyrosinase family protein [Fimbriimonadales bacterium]
MLTAFVLAVLTGPLHTPPSIAPPPMMVRKNLRSLSATELQGLRDAVAAMQALPASDPCSWDFQANIHNSRCDHSVEFWLPWHRMYLYYFEKILVGHSGGKLKGLPYWDYTQSTETKFPGKYYPANYTSGGSTHPNPLYHSPRTNVTSPSFSLSFGSTDVTADDTNLVFDAFSGALQIAPHNYVHNAISGTMGTFLSPLDAIFWTHHCVLDRQWQKWLGMGGGRANPTWDSTWMNTSFSFYDYDKGCKLVSKQVKDVLDPGKQLNYKYVDETTVASIPPWWKWVLLVPPFRLPNPPESNFGFDPLQVQIQLPANATRNLAAALGRTNHQLNVILNFHVSKGENTPVPFDMFVTSAGGQRVRLGTLSVFGVHQEAMQGHSHDMAGVFKMTLTPKASADFLAVLRGGKAQLSFTPMVNDAARQANAPALVMSLTSIAVMEAVPVDQNGNRIKG